jgi:DNA-binding PadR family transcriptional regulator
VVYCRAMEQDLVLNATSASLLGFLQMGPMTGWELEKAVERSIGSFWNVTRSQIYRELRNLASSGLAVPGEAGPRDRQPYTITEAGRTAFAEWIGRLPGPEIIRFPLLLTVFFGDHLDPARLRRHLREHELAHLHRLESYEQQQAQASEDPESGPVLVRRFGIEYERAVLRWFASLPGYEPVER